VMVCSRVSSGGGLGNWSSFTVALWSNTSSFASEGVEVNA
jgi:hypothetical protein